VTLRIAERCRVVVDNDWAGDPDGLVALAHHLLSRANRVVAVTGSANSPVFGPPAGTAAAGARLAQELVDLVGTHRPVVAAGCDVPIGGARPGRPPPTRSSPRRAGTTRCRSSSSAAGR
jgi:purine nucleosidase